MRTLMIGTLVALLLPGCDRGTETRTFALRHLQPSAALDMIGPYVPEAEANLRATTEPASLTITAPRVRLDQIAQVLETYDQPGPDVRLRFQVIEADGFTGTDPAIADVEQALRELFRFSGYRLAGEAVVQARAPAEVYQALASDDETYTLGADVERIVTGDAGKAVELSVSLGSSGNPMLIRTSLTVPSGQTVVVGSARGQEQGSTIILVVRPVIE